MGLGLGGLGFGTGLDNYPIYSGEDEMKIIASTQNPTLTQLTVAGVLGLTANKVVVTVKRMGGGFGGKESRLVIISLSHS